MGIDPEKIRLKPGDVPTEKAVGPPRTSKVPLKRFLKGPIPIDWLSKAAMLPGRALHVGVALWYLSGMEKSYTVKLSSKTAGLFGVDRFAKARALDAMEQAGLVRVERGKGKAPTITIIPPSTDNTLTTPCPSKE